jgi:glycolate oxidase FAD binding subunit
MALQITFPVSQLPEALKGIAAVERKYGFVTKVRGRAGSGVLRIQLGALDTETMVAAVEDVRGMALACGGSAVVVQAPVEVKQEIDVWGPKPDAWPLMQRVKAEFDPENIMSPGRFIGRL